MIGFTCQISIIELVAVFVCVDEANVGNHDTTGHRSRVRRGQLEARRKIIELTLLLVWFFHN
jgi:hypothetical protein